jgi:lipoprotein NlpI
MDEFVKFIMIVTTLVSLALIQGCSSQLGRTQSASMPQLIIAEPLVVSYKSEIALARLTEVIMRADITDVQRAQFFYDRGVIYDSVGLKSLARLDFNRALRLKPDLVDAYNFLGIQYTQLQEFNQAYDAFDSALELEPKHEYAYLNRGIALYYGGRADLSLKDFTTFYNHQKNDPYRILWLYLAEAKLDQSAALTQLKQQLVLVDDNVWAKQIIQLYAGELSVDKFIRQLTHGIETNEKLTDRLCEAYFYLGKYYLFLNQASIAANYFKLSLSTNVYEFVEHRYARLELDLMRNKIQGKVEPESSEP